MFSFYNLYLSIVIFKSIWGQLGIIFFLNWKHIFPIPFLFWNLDSRETELCALKWIAVKFLLCFINWACLCGWIFDILISQYNSYSTVFRYHSFLLFLKFEVHILFVYVYISTMLILFQDKSLFSSILQHKEATAMDMKNADNR